MLSWLLGQAIGAGSMDQDDDDASWFFPSLFGRGRTRSGIRVNQFSALNYSAVFCASRILCETIASLPIGIFSQSKGGDKERDLTHPLDFILNVSPNPDCSAAPFHEGRVLHQVNWGNAYAEIEWDATRRQVLALWPIHPSRVEPFRDPQGRRVYLIKANNPQDNVTLTADRMLHIPGALSENGIEGKGVLTHAAESCGLGMAADAHGSKFFGKGSRPQGVLTVGGNVNDSKVRETTRQEWKSVYGGENSDAEIAVLGNGSAYTQVTIPNDQAQFLETRKFQISEFARWYRVPAHMLGDLERATHSNIEHQGIEFVVYSLITWAVKREQEISRKLLTAADRKKGLTVEHIFAALLRGDIKARYEAYKVGLQNGWLTLNMIARLEGLPSAGAEGDVRMVMANMTTLPILIAGGNLKGMAGAKTDDEEPGDDETGDDKPPKDPAPDPNTDPPPAPKKKKKKKPAPAPAPAPAKDNAAMQEAARAVLVDSLERMVAIESNWLRRQAERKQNIPTGAAPLALKTFLPSYEAKLIKALPLALAACQAAGLPTQEATPAIAHVVATLNDTPALSDVTATARVQTLTAWILAPSIPNPQS